MSDFRRKRTKSLWLALVALAALACADEGGNGDAAASEVAATEELAPGAGAENRVWVEAEWVVDTLLGGPADTLLARPNALNVRTRAAALAMLLLLAFPATFALLGGAAPLQAQDWSFRAAAGAAIPVGGAGDRRDIGPAAMLSVENRLSRFWSLRLDGEWSLLSGPSGSAGEEYQDLHAIGASLNGILRVPADPISPYLLAGVGAYRLQEVDAPASPYGITAALQAGFGIDGNFWGRVHPFVEVRAMVHATDYGSDEYAPTVYWPILIGLRVL